MLTCPLRQLPSWAVHALGWFRKAEKEVPILLHSLPLQRSRGQVYGMSLHPGGTLAPSRQDSSAATPGLISPEGHHVVVREDPLPGGRHVSLEDVLRLAFCPRLWRRDQEKLLGQDWHLGVPIKVAHELDYISTL